MFLLLQAFVFPVNALEKFSGERSGITYTGAEFNSVDCARANKAMTAEKKIRQRLLWSALPGLCLLVAGLLLLRYTPLGFGDTLAGLTTTVILIALGLLLLVPAKVYLILRLTRGRRGQGRE